MSHLAMSFEIGSASAQRVGQGEVGGCKATRRHMFQTCYSKLLQSHKERGIKLGHIAHALSSVPVAIVFATKRKLILWP